MGMRHAEEWSPNVSQPRRCCETRLVANAAKYLGGISAADELPSLIPSRPVECLDSLYYIHVHVSVE